MEKVQIPLCDLLSTHLGTETDAGQLGWAHGANTRRKLEAALDNPRVSMIEVDIGIGKLRTEQETSTDIILAHYPQVQTSDISLSDALQLINSHEQGNQTTKGIKLDFKADFFLVAGLKRVRSGAPSFVMLNADVLQGPQGGPSCNGPFFLREALKLHPQASLSLGWTLAFFASLPYTQEMCDKMYELCTTDHGEGVPAKVVPHITFAVRSDCCDNPVSKASLNALLDSLPGTSLTIYSSRLGDCPAAQHRLRTMYGSARVMYDFKNPKMPRTCTSLFQSFRFLSFLGWRLVSAPPRQETLTET